MFISKESYEQREAEVSQLPVGAYFNPSLLEMEQERLFAARPQYAGHELLVPEPNDYFVLPHHDNGLVMVRGDAGVQIISNVCRHRQALILDGNGNAKRISCPMHRWTYDTSGQLVAAPRFPERPCARLERFNSYSWNGLHFIGQEVESRDLEEIPSAVRQRMELGAFRFGHTEVHHCAYNWKTFIEFYLEDYHVAPFHPGLGRFVSCDDLQWYFGAEWSVQTVGFHKALRQPGSSVVYRGWHDAVLRYYGGSLPSVAVVWFLMYPNVMIECYPLVTVISTVHPAGPERCINVVEYYHPRDLDRFTDGDDMAALAAAAYLETAVEDNAIGERMQAGRHALLKRGKSECGPYHHPLESGMQHFHRYFRSRVAVPM